MKFGFDSQGLSYVLEAENPDEAKEAIKQRILSERKQLEWKQADLVFWLNFQKDLNEKFA